MHLDLTPDQEALRAGIADVCAGVFPMDVLRTMIDPSSGAGLDGLDRARWRKLAETGVFSLDRSEGLGGLGLGLAEAAIVFEELGRALVPGPLAGTYLAAGLVADGLIDGAEPDDIIGVAPLEIGGGVVVEHAASLDWLVLIADQGLRLVAGDEVRSLVARSGEPHTRSLDPLTPVDRLTETPAGEVIGTADDAARWRRDGALLVAAQSAGLAAAMVDLAATYAGEREQFDRPIGSFQAVKHLLADMLTRAELARIAVEAAAVTVDQPEVGDADEMVHSAKVIAGEAATANGRSCVQIHGGMGYAWEVDAHLYLKRAWVLDHQFGSAAAHTHLLAAGAL